VPKKAKSQLDRTKAMRGEPTGPEARLWHCLRAKRFEGVKFTQQVLIGPCIVDFAARDRKLAIELDGDSHGPQESYDARRTALIEREGFRVIRFTNADVMTNLEGVLQTIADTLAALPLSQPSPRRGEGF
jgi:very-short-patch-repair endonuclease